MKIKLIGKKILRIIYDKSSDIEYFIINKIILDKPNCYLKIKYSIAHIFGGMLSKLEKIDYSKFLFTPFGIVHSCWQLMLLILLVFNVIYLPLFLSFDYIS